MRVTEQELEKILARLGLDEAGRPTPEAVEALTYYPPPPESEFTEHQEQARVVRWAERAARADERFGLLYAIPNGEKRRSGGAKVAEGLRKGVPDLHLPVPSRGMHGLYIEMKKCKTSKSPAGKLSDDQKWWIEQLKKQGYRAVTCWGAEAAIAEMKWYLGYADKTC